MSCMAYLNRYGVFLKFNPAFSHLPKVINSLGHKSCWVLLPRIMGSDFFFFLFSPCNLIHNETCAVPTSTLYLSVVKIPSYFLVFMFVFIWISLLNIIHGILVASLKINLKKTIKFKLLQISYLFSYNSLTLMVKGKFIHLKGFYALFIYIVFLRPFSGSDVCFIKWHTDHTNYINYP